LKEAPEEIIARIVETLKKNPGGLNIQKIARLSGLNRMSVAKYLDVLTAQESVRVRMFGRAKVYSFAGRRLPVDLFRKHMPLHYVITDSDLTVIQLNDYVPRTVGKVGIRLPDMFSGHVANCDECMKAFEEAIAGSPSTVIAERLFPGGSRFCELFSMPIRFPDGSPGMISFSVDITRERMARIEAQAEADQLRALLEGLACPVFRAGADGILTYLSPRGAELGLDPGTCTGRLFSDLAVQEDRKIMDDGLRAIRESGEGTICFSAVRPDSRKVRLEAVCRAQRDPAGTCTGITGLLRDAAGDALPGWKKATVQEG